MILAEINVFPLIFYQSVIIIVHSLYVNHWSGLKINQCLVVVVIMVPGMVSGKTLQHCQHMSHIASDQ